MLPYVAKHWRGKIWRMHAYQTFGGNKLTNNLCSTFKIFQSQVLVRLNFSELTTIH